MGYQLVDDYDGTPLDRDHDPIELRVGVEGWQVYLADQNKDALRKAIEPFIKTAEPIAQRPRAASSPQGRRGGSRASSSKNSHGYENKDVRAWAIANGVKNVKSTGEETAVGDRGVMAQNVYDAYRDAMEKGGKKK